MAKLVAQRYEKASQIEGPKDVGHFIQQTLSQSCVYFLQKTRNVS